MSFARCSVLSLLIAMTLSLGSLRAQILNGDFESFPPLVNWTVEWASVQSCQAPNWSPSAPPVGHPGASTVEAGYSTCGGSFTVDPYEATKMCRLNNAAGGCHATRIHQTFPLRLVDKDAGGKLGIEWGAHLQDPGHSVNCQPFFSIVVFVNGSAFKSFSANATDAAAGTDPGWQDVGCNYYYKKGIFCVDLSRCPTNSQIKVQMTVADCGACGHGGEAFLDNVRWLTGTPAPGDMVGWWADATLVDVTPFNNDGNWVGTVPWYAPGYVKTGMPFTCSPAPRYAVIPDDSSLDFGAASLTSDNGDFSIDAWVRPTDISGIRPIVSKMSHTTFTMDAGYQFYLEDGRLTLLLSGGGSASTTNFNIYTSVGAVTPDEWSFVGVSVDRVVSESGGIFTGEVKFYVNGRCLETEVPEIFNPNAPNDMMASLENSAPLYLGYTENTYDGSMFIACTPACFEGYIDEVEIFSRALDCSEMTRLFQAGCCGKQRCDQLGSSPAHPFWQKWCWIWVSPGPVSPAPWTPVLGNMFDVVATDSVNVRGLEMNLEPGFHTLEIYSAAGTHVGQETNPSVWNLLGTVQSVESLGRGVSTILPIRFNQQIPAGQTQAFYVRSVSGAGFNAGEGPGVGAPFGRGQSLSIHSGTELNAPFSPSGQRSFLFNGSLIFDVTDGLVCDFCQTADLQPSGPLLVNFFDQSFATSSTGIVSYAWDFESDGVIDSQLANPSMVFPAPGIYPVTYTVTDGLRTRTVTRSLAIEPERVAPTMTIASPPILGTTAIFDLSSPQDPGRQYICGFSTGTTPGIALPHLTIPLNLDAFLYAVFDPSNPIAGLFTGTLGVLDSNGFANSTMIVPNEPAISGLTLYGALVVLDPNQPLGIASASAPATITLQ